MATSFKHGMMLMHVDDVETPTVETDVRPYELRNVSTTFQVYAWPESRWTCACSAQWQQTEVSAEEQSQGAIQRFPIKDAGSVVLGRSLWGGLYECPKCGATWEVRR